MATQPSIVGGLSLYAVSSIGFIVVLSRANISIVSPLLSISYLFTVLGGKIGIHGAFAAAAVSRRGAMMTGVIFVLQGQSGGTAGGN